jgi:hypothetical protein
MNRHRPAGWSWITHPSTWTDVILLALVAAILLVLGGYLLWRTFLSPLKNPRRTDAERLRLAAHNLKAAMETWDAELNRHGLLGGGSNSQGAAKASVVTRPPASQLPKVQPDAPKPPGRELAVLEGHLRHAILDPAAAGRLVQDEMRATGCDRAAAIREVLRDLESEERRWS